MLYEKGHEMNFTKYHIAGKDYLFFADITSFNNLSETDIKALCDRHKGVGADGIFTFQQNCHKNSNISGFLQNGEIMRDFFSASVCAFFALFSDTPTATHTFLTPKGENLTVKSIVSGEKHRFLLILKTTSPSQIFKEALRKTEIGNRILTITPVYLHGANAVHFSPCKEKLDIAYLGKHLSSNSLFGKQVNTILAQQTEDNTFDIDFYENRTGCPRPTIAAYSAAALAACKTGLSEYGQKIRVTYNENSVTVICPSETEIMAECEAAEIFQGKT